MYTQLHTTFTNMKQAVVQNHQKATQNFVFTFIFVNLFQALFGAQNTIVGVIFVIIMPSSMLMDLTRTPVKHFFIQCAILETMTISAFLVTHLNPYGALAINVVVLFLLLYAFTFEYVSDLYMPYILSYLFLIFIAPVTAQALPKRMLGILVGSMCIILYQLVMGRHRAGETASDALRRLLDEAERCVLCLLAGEGVPDSPATVHGNLCKLSHMIYARRKRAFHISDAEMSMLACGLAIEKLIGQLYDFEGEITADCTVVLENTTKYLSTFRQFINSRDGLLPPISMMGFFGDSDDFGRGIYQTLVSLRNSLLHMANPQKRKTYRQTLLSFSTQVKATIAASPVRVVYSLRVAALLAGLTLAVQLLQLPHGKWLLFTVASVSLPIAEDVGEKAKKRLLATLIGGCVSVVAFALVPTQAGRTAIMLLSGYSTSYFSDYKFSFACATVGALGGAVLMNAFGFVGVGSIFLLRLFYICLGIAVAYIANCIFFPFHKKTATGQLYASFLSMYQLLLRVRPTWAQDPQRYYSLVVQLLLQEESLRAKMGQHDWERIQADLQRDRPMGGASQTLSMLRK